jgi:hypothetical protein
LLSALKSFKPSEASRVSDRLHAVLEIVEGLERVVPNRDVAVVAVMEDLLRGFLDLCKWIEASLAGEASSERHLRAAQTRALLFADRLPSQHYPEFALAARTAGEAMKNVSSIGDISGVAELLRRAPVPVLQAVEDRLEPIEEVVSGPRAGDAVLDGTFVVKVMFEVDRRPWSTPQTLRANTLYDLSAAVTVPEWPEGSDRLKIDYVATLTQDHYKLKLPLIERPQNSEKREFRLEGHAEFPVAQNILSSPLDIVVRATFVSSAGQRRIPATIVGYNRLNVRVSDGAHGALPAGYDALDQRTLEILEEVDRSVPQVDPQHRADFIAALGSVANYLGISLQQALYSDKEVKESDFQRDLLYHLRSRLGGDVQEAPRQGGGPTDIQYRSVNVELKVEKRIRDRRKMIGKYLPQASQYSAAGGSQLGILCILDLTEKRDPPANPKNQITLETPAVHGFERGEVSFPTKIATVVIDGNLRKPSDYSKRI